MVTNQIRILIVEDSPLIAKTLRRTFENYGIIDHAGTGKDALLQAEKEQYTLIIMDIGLPDFSGIEVTRSIRETEGKNQHTAIIAFSAHINAEQQQECLDLKMNEVFIKPFSNEALKHIIERYLS